MKRIEGRDVSWFSSRIHVVVNSDIIERGKITESWGKTIESGVRSSGFRSGEDVDMRGDEADRLRTRSSAKILRTTNLTHSRSGRGRTE